MITTTDISKKLDGNVVIQKAEARGHMCTWDCLKKPQTECLHNDELAYQQLLIEQIERSKGALKNVDTHYGDYIIHYSFLKDLNLLPKPKKTTRYELGAREFTLTYSPKWMDDAQAREGMEKAINKLTRYYADVIVNLRAVGEVGSNGLSHVHCFYKIVGGLKITDKNFQRAWKYWNPKKPMGRGFEGGHHATVKEESDFLGYIEKDIETSWLDINISSAQEV